MLITPIAASDVNGVKDERQMLEKTLIRRVVRGDAESFCELVGPYQRSAYVRALSILGNDADAEEVVQESILKAFRSLSQFRNKSKFSTWFVQIVINEARLKLRKDKRHLYESLECERLGCESRCQLGDSGQSRETPLQCLEREELKRAISRSLKSLPAKYRSVLELRELNELSTLDTAKTLGISVVNVKTRLWRARVQLRGVLTPLLGFSDGSRSRPWCYP
jgi:RNA polymerase sigma-70 factor, ECF subfamily